MNQHERIVRARKPGKCPVCGHHPVATILYGLPDFSEKLKTEIKAGKVILGGCMCLIGSPEWECPKCHQGIHKRDPE